MPEYVYKVQNVTGKITKGKLDAKDQNAAIETLKTRGLYPIEVKEASALNKDLDLPIFNRVTLRDLSVFCRQFSTVISAGITVMNSLDIMRQQTENKKLKEIIEQLFEEVQKGRSLSSVMREHKEFPLLFINMVEAGESSGQLELMLNKMALYYEKEYRLRSKIRSALTYPIVISIVAVAVVIFMVTTIIPTFANMITSGGGKLPLPTRILLGLSYGISHYWLIILIVIVLVAYLFRKYSKTAEGRYRNHKFLLNCPVIGKVNRKIVTSRFSSTLSILLGSGIPVIQAMDIVEKTVTNAVVEKGINKCKDEIKRGAGLSRPIAGMGIFPPMLTEMISIGEESGQIDDMLFKTSEFYDSEVDIAVSNLTTLLEPIIIVFLGVIVAFIVISIVMPMFDMYQYVA
jgi:Type II secretory pathway, component PulF